MIDIHSHILPDLDDGARTLEEAVEMARIAVNDGITHMIATPHAFNGLSSNPSPEEISTRVKVLQEAIGRDLEILPGNEVHFIHDITGKLETQQITPLNHRNYMLIEFPTMQVPPGAGQLFRKLQTIGITPILAHPERNLQIQKHPEIIAGLIESGGRIQVTAMSVNGKFGVAAFECVQTLLSHNCVHFIATDSHRAKSRPPVLSEARAQAARIIGADAAEKLVEDNPRAVVMGEPIEAGAPVPFERASIEEGAFARFFRRQTPRT
jgi:protein-tyrosine phosphatase